MKSKNLILLLSLAVFIFLGFSTQTVSANDNNKPLRSVIGDGALLMDFGIFDDEGRLLVWSLAVKGDVDGYMVWWFDMPFAEPLFHEDFIVNFYTSRWEIYDVDPYPPDGSGGVILNPDAKILLAGFSAGETLYATDPVDSDGNWDGDGIVTETSQEFRKWRGCVMHEGGPVLVSSATGAPGKIRVYPHGFRPRDLLNKPAIGNKEESNIENELRVMNNYPNPFNPSTTIEFNLAEATQVRIDIYNVMGQKVETLLDKEMNAGSHSVKWNASEMASGIYYYKVQAKGFQNVKRMILIK